MPTPQHRSSAYPRPTKKLEEDLDMRYLAPGAFTVLPDNGSFPEPPPAPPTHRLPTTTRRHKHQSFAIIGEPSGSSTTTGSGRVSPFKGRGFNPLGSRHASPLGSPIPPEDPRSSPRVQSPRSRIPKPAGRRGSSGQVFGEKVFHHAGSSGQLSKSLTNLKPPPNPKRTAKRPVAFQQLSPIAGSSPEASQSLSSPSRIPTKSKSTPASRLTSPTRVLVKKRDPSPGSTKIPVRKYEHVRSKIDSHRGKPKIAPKPQSTTDQSEESDVPKNTTKKNNAGVDSLPKTTNFTSDSEVEVNATTNAKSTVNNVPNVVQSNEESLPSTTEMVSSTTTAVTKPLHIETPQPQPPPPVAVDRSKAVSPLIDGRVLSATSVSQAINKMNDTVLNTQTLIKEHGLCPRTTPSAVTATADQDKRQEDNKPITEDKKTTIVNKNNNNNHVAPSNNHHVTQIGLGPVKAPETVKMSANDRIREARTVIAADVKPIRITVREKPSSVEVQSGNVGPRVVTIANGLDERPGLPPTQQQPPPNEPPPPKDEQAPNACKKFFTLCSGKLPCQKCRKQPALDDTAGCFKCLKKKKVQDQVRISVEDEETNKFWDRFKCCKKNKVGDVGGCLPIGKRKGSWLAESAEPKIADANTCKRFLRAVFCVNLCLGCANVCKRKKKQPEEVPVSRKASMVSSKKKSLTPTTLPPPEDTTPKIDISLVEHTSHMKAAIPILPVWLAWFCCLMNCIGPGTGTILSGLFCLCIGKPRFSQKDGPKPRIGAFLIDLIIGFSQCFTVLFCLVGWGWSIWWGVIMIKVARRHRKLKQLESIEENASRPTPNLNQRRDPDRRA